jgi:LacI family transcriptional regulator
VAVTIDEVARVAGVSRSTVSLVVRGQPRVADATRERVEAAIAALGYRPSRLASGLRSNRSYILGLVVSSLSFPHHARIAVGVEEAVEDAGYSVLVANSRGSAERERRHIERLRRYQADGLLVAPLQHTAADAAHLQALHDGGYPLVTIYREVPGLRVPFCGVDAYDSVRRLVAYLAGPLGHRRIALIAGDGGSPVTAQRVAGWRDELRARGLPPDPRAVAPADGAGGGHAAAARLLAAGVPFSALVCINDFLALGALRALHLAGRRVPQDVSVAAIGGFDELASPRQTLTVLAYDYRSIGRRAGELLRRRIEEPWSSNAAGGAERRLITPALRPGETTAPFEP